MPPEQQPNNSQMTANEIRASLGIATQLQEQLMMPQQEPIEGEPIPTETPVEPEIAPEQEKTEEVKKEVAKEKEELKNEIKEIRTDIKLIKKLLLKEDGERTDK